MTVRFAVAFAIGIPFRAAAGAEASPNVSDAHLLGLDRVRRSSQNSVWTESRRSAQSAGGTCLAVAGVSQRRRTESREDRAIDVLWIA